MTHSLRHPAQRRQRFTRLSDDCPICRLMEHLDGEGLLDWIEIDDDDDDDEFEVSAYRMPNVQSFDRMPVEAARVLLRELPEAPPAREGARPSLAEMIALAERFPGLLLHGYRVDPSGPNDHVLVEGFYVPLESAQQVRDALGRKPEGWEALAINGHAYWRAWWA